MNFVVTTWDLVKYTKISKRSNQWYKWMKLLKNQTVGSLKFEFSHGSLEFCTIRLWESFSLKSASAWKELHHCDQTVLSPYFMKRSYLMNWPKTVLLYETVLFDKRSNGRESYGQPVLGIEQQCKSKRYSNEKPTSLKNRLCRP